MPLITKFSDDNHITGTGNIETIKEWNTPDSKIRAVNHDNKIHFLINQQGVNTTIAAYNIMGVPTQSLIDIPMWRAFLSDTSARLSGLGGNEYKLYITPRLNGGGNIEKDPKNLWPKGIVPYEIDSKKYPVGEKERPMILAAIKEWETKTQFTFVPRTTQTDVLIFGEEEGVCYANVGYQGGEQYIRCDLDGGGFNKLSIMHEIGHAIGMYHEHQRYDRDNFVEITPGGKAADYKKTSEGNAFGRYDLASIMHYYFDDDASIKAAKMTPKLELPEGARAKVGTKAKLSPGDIAATKELYRLSQGATPKPVPVPPAPIPSKTAFRAMRAPVAQAKDPRQAGWKRLLNQGEIHFNREQYNSALKNYMALINEYGQSLDERILIKLNNGCGICHFHLGNYHVALTWFDGALDIDPNDQTIQENYRKTQHRLYGKIPAFYK